MREEGGHSISHHGPIKCWGVETLLFINGKLRIYHNLFYIVGEMKGGGRLYNFTVLVILLRNKVLWR